MSAHRRVCVCVCFCFNNILFCSRKRTELHKKKSQQQIEKEVRAITDKLTSYPHEQYGVPPNSSNMEQFSSSLGPLFDEQHINCSLSYLDLHHMRNDLKLIHLIKRKLHKAV